MTQVVYNVNAAKNLVSDVPININVESVSIRREEIEATMRLAQQQGTQIRG